MSPEPTDAPIPLGGGSLVADLYGKLVQVERVLATAAAEMQGLRTDVGIIRGQSAALEQRLEKRDDQHAELVGRVNQLEAKRTVEEAQEMKIEVARQVKTAIKAEERKAGIIGRWGAISALAGTGIVAAVLGWLAKKLWG